MRKLNKKGSPRDMFFFIGFMFFFVLALFVAYKTYDSIKTSLIDDTPVGDDAVAVAFNVKFSAKTGKLNKINPTKTITPIIIFDCRANFAVFCRRCSILVITPCSNTRKHFKFSIH